MKKSNLWMILTLPVWVVSCQNKEFEADESESMELKLEASVANASLSRTTTEGCRTDFLEKDQIGFFMPKNDTPVSWTYTSNSWVSESVLLWPDRETTYTFSAFYPYQKDAVRTKVTMPDLSLQKGQLSEVGKFDFLTAETSSSYATSLSGVVSFTGKDAFHHQYSMIQIVLKDTETSAAKLTSFSLKGTDVATRQYYDFTTHATSSLGEASVNQFLLKPVPGEETISPEGWNAWLLVNPSSGERELDLMVEYSRDGQSYQARTQAIKQTFEAGKWYRYTLRINDKNLVIVNSEIVDWEEVVDMGDLPIDGEKIES